MKALLVVATLISSAVEEFPEKEARTYVKHIFKAILASDKWKTFDATNSERFKLQAAQTALSSVLLKLFEMGKPLIQTSYNVF
jgi:hypothetical protein